MLLAVCRLRRALVGTLVFSMLLLGGAVHVPAPYAAEPATVAEWARFEASYVPPVTPANPFDPAEIDVRAQFVSPGGKLIEVLGFWHQAYERELRPNGNERLTPVGTPHFRVRFTPTRPGRWRWRWVVRQDGATTSTPLETLQVKPAKDPGFLRLSRRDPRYLAFDDGSPFFAVGENTGWYDARGTFAYDEWLARLAEQGANYGRLWMPPWAFGLEWDDTPLGDYTNRLDRAWQLDHVIEEAERRGIYVMLSLINHGAFATFFNGTWAQNPYNAANGGPLARAADFFTDPTARALFERRLRYVVARWGWSTHIHSWELWNEVDLTDGYRSSSVTQWHADMAALLRALDPYDHLVTTSHAFYPNDPNVWRDGGLDFTQIHFYADNFPPFANLGRTINMWTRERLGVTGAPVLFAEIGVDSRGPAETIAADPGGIGVHDALWAGVVSGGIGTGMTWWWDNVIDREPDLYYPMFGAVARFVEGIRWDRERFAPASVEVESASRPVVAYGLHGRSRLLLWIKDDAFQWNSPNAVEIADATLRVDGRRWCGQWYDPWQGVWLDTVKLDGTVAVPPFSRDLALLAGRCPAKDLRR